MAVYLYGNIDGRICQPKTTDLFEMAKKQCARPAKTEQICDTKANRGGLGTDECKIQVNISKEGLMALHGSRFVVGTSQNGNVVGASQRGNAGKVGQDGNAGRVSQDGNADGVRREIIAEGTNADKTLWEVNPDKLAEEKAFLNEHQPIESFTSRFSNAMLSSYEKTDSGGYQYVHRSVREKADTLLKCFEKICGEIYEGYDNDIRVRYIEDASSEDGFRKLTREDELAILQDEFNEFVDKRFGREHQKQSEAVTKALNDFQRIKQSMGRGNVRYYEPEIIPEGFAGQIKAEAEVILGKHI